VDSFDFSCESVQYIYGVTKFKAIVKNCSK